MISRFTCIRVNDTSRGKGTWRYTILYLSITTRLSSGPKIGGDEVYINAKDRGHLNDIFENRFKVR
jgi:hypothetical protein